MSIRNQGHRLTGECLSTAVGGAVHASPLRAKVVVVVEVVGAVRPKNVNFLNTTPGSSAVHVEFSNVSCIAIELSRTIESSRAPDFSHLVRVSPVSVARVEKVRSDEKEEVKRLSDNSERLVYSSSRSVLTGQQSRSVWHVWAANEYLSGGYPPSPTCRNDTRNLAAARMPHKCFLFVCNRIIPRRLEQAFGCKELQCTHFYIYVCWLRPSWITPRGR